MDLDEWESLPWHQQYEAACVTIVRGLSVDDVVALWPDRPLTPLTDADAVERWPAYVDGDVRGLLAIGTLDDGALFVWEPEGGFQASDRTLLAGLSRGGSACVNYWNDVNCTPTFGYAERGTTRRYFTTDDPAMSYGTGVDVPLPEESDLSWPVPEQELWLDGRGSALILQSRLMACPAPDPAWLDRDGVRWWGTPFFRDREA